MASLKELLAQKESIERQIEETKKEERGEAVAKVRALMSEYGLTISDLGTRTTGRGKGGAGAKVAAKYRNSSTGETWSGRGLQPRWLKAATASGKRLEDFAV